MTDMTARARTCITCHEPITAERQNGVAGVYRCRTCYAALSRLQQLHLQAVSHADSHPGDCPGRDGGRCVGGYCGRRPADGTIGLGALVTTTVRDGVVVGIPDAASVTVHWLATGIRETVPAHAVRAVPVLA